MKDAEVLLHNKIHESMMAQDPDTIFGPRVQIFRYFEERFTNLHGRVLDVGAGNGYASIWLSMNHPTVSEIVALEASEPAAKILIPRNVTHHGANNIKVINGTFDQIPSTGAFDFIIAFGALHHSENLRKTCAALAANVKPGGFLIAQEPVMPDTTTHEEYQKKYDIVEERFGIQIRNGDRTDQFFRHCEYLAAAITSGFDLVHEAPWPPKSKNAEVPTEERTPKAINMQAALRRLCATLKHSKQVNPRPVPPNPPPTWVERMQQATRDVAPTLLVFKKSPNQGTYHDFT